MVLLLPAFTNPLWANDNCSLKKKFKCDLNFSLVSDVTKLIYIFELRERSVANFFNIFSYISSSQFPFWVDAEVQNLPKKEYPGFISGLTETKKQCKSHFKVSLNCHLDFHTKKVWKCWAKLQISNQITGCSSKLNLWIC